MVIIRSVGLALGVALVFAVGATLFRRRFGAEEIPLVVVYAIPLVILTGLGALGIRSIGRSHPVLGYTAPTLSGVLLGLAWIYAFAFALGGWFFAIGLPPLPVWIAAAVAGVTAGVLSAALLSGALLALQQARQHPGFVAVFRAVQ